MKNNNSIVIWNVFRLVALIYSNSLDSTTYVLTQLIEGVNSVTQSCLNRFQLFQKSASDAHIHKYRLVATIKQAIHLLTLIPFTTHYTKARLRCFNHHYALCPYLIGTQSPKSCVFHCCIQMWKDIFVQYCPYTERHVSVVKNPRRPLERTCDGGLVASRKGLYVIATLCDRGKIVTFVTAWHRPPRCTSSTSARRMTSSVNNTASPMAGHRSGRRKLRGEDVS